MIRRDTEPTPLGALAVLAFLAAAGTISLMSGLCSSIFNLLGR